MGTKEEASSEKWGWNCPKSRLRSRETRYSSCHFIQPSMHSAVQSQVRCQATHRLVGQDNKLPRGLGSHGRGLSREETGAERREKKGGGFKRYRFTGAGSKVGTDKLTSMLVNI